MFGFIYIASQIGHLVGSFSWKGNSMIYHIIHILRVNWISLNIYIFNLKHLF